MPLQLDDLAALDAPAPDTFGQPLMLPIDSIDEDPDQPRREFDASTLQELADTIRDRGVRQPISVRPYPQIAGRWVLNFGARRLRASKLAGLSTIPAFVDASTDSYDQVIENEQREGLKPLELALFVQKRLALGESRSEIARRLGKSKQWLTLAAALVEAPRWLLDVHHQGRCNGLNELHELRRLYSEYPVAVEHWAAQQNLITRPRIAALKQTLAESRPTAAPSPANKAAPLPDTPGASGPGEHGRASRRIHVELDGQDFQLLVSAVPPEPGTMYIVPLAGGPRRSAPADALRLRGFCDS
ncbi:MAG: ParB/RepB/Spo0J family partition protein [Burkholderiaceae bacterium]|nr:ParB/RepB/Spo0J family partition protein [Burkholderiaceae bacterium]